jgi:hypothetical protein
MDELESWKVLNAGSRADLVLAVDYSSTGRRESGFPDLAENLNQSWALWETTQPPLGAEATMSTQDYVDRWVDEARATGQPVRAVLGYCVGAVFAGAIAAEIARWQSTPPLLVIFDPSVPISSNLMLDFDNVLTHYAGILGADQVAYAQRAARRAYAEDDDFPWLGARYAEIFREVVAAAFDREGLDPEHAAELADTFLSFIGYLNAARPLDPKPWWAKGIAVSAVPPTEHARFAGREIKVDVPHVDILRSTEVAGTVSDLLDS